MPPIMYPMAPPRPAIIVKVDRPKAWSSEIEEESTIFSKLLQITELAKFFLVFVQVSSNALILSCRVSEREGFYSAGQRVVPRLRESGHLAPSGRGA